MFFKFVPVIYFFWTSRDNSICVCWCFCSMNFFIMSFCCLRCSTLASNSSLLNGIFSFPWSLSCSCFCLRCSTTSEEPPLLFFCVDSRGFTFHVSFLGLTQAFHDGFPVLLSFFFPPFLCSLPRSIFHRLTSPCQLFLLELLGLVLTPGTKCQRHFPLAYFCFILSDKQSQPVSYWSFANYESWMIKAVEVNGNVVTNIHSLFAPVWVLIGFHHQDFSAKSYMVFVCPLHVL